MSTWTQRWTQMNGADLGGSAVFSHNNKNSSFLDKIHSFILWLLPHTVRKRAAVLQSKTPPPHLSEPSRPHRAMIVPAPAPEARVCSGRCIFNRSRLYFWMKRHINTTCWCHVTSQFPAPCLKQTFSFSRLPPQVCVRVIREVCGNASSQVVNDVTE